MSPVGDTLESLPAEPLQTGLYVSHRELFLRHSSGPAPPRQCASVSPAERARDPSSAGLKKDTRVPKWWFYFFSFYVCMEIVDKVKEL